MLMQALRPWANLEQEGYVSTGDQFQATEYRARELERLGLAIQVTADDAKIAVKADLGIIKAELGVVRRKTARS